MVDTSSRRERSRIMAAVKSKGTAPEMTVRRIVSALGYRYRLHVKGLPGCPDLVFASRRKAIFVHGCFWHRHNCRNGRSMPTTRRKYWQEKFRRNRERDSRSRRILRREGWQVLVIWECKIRNSSRTVEAIRRFISE